MDLLFNKQRSHRVNVPSLSQDGRPANITFLIHWIRDNLLKERVELFMEGNTMYVDHTYDRAFLFLLKDRRRPGILILINDTDWELEDEGDYVLKSGDEVVFISTLHGG